MVELTPKIIAFYKDLANGDCQFEVKAKDVAGNTSEPEVKEFSVVKTNGGSDSVR